MINVYLLTQEYLKIFQNQNRDIVNFTIFFLFLFLPKNETKNSESIEEYFSSKMITRKKIGMGIQYRQDRQDRQRPMATKTNRLFLVVLV